MVLHQFILVELRFYVILTLSKSNKNHTLMCQKSTFCSKNFLLNEIISNFVWMYKTYCLITVLTCRLMRWTTNKLLPLVHLTRGPTNPGLPYCKWKPSLSELIWYIVSENHSEYDQEIIELPHKRTPLYNACSNIHNNRKYCTQLQTLALQSFW